MPGRGANWRGVGEGNQDRIGSGEIEDDSITSADIKDLTITDGDIANATISESKLDSGVTAKLNAGSDGVGYDEIKDEGTPLTKRAKLNFIGTGVTAVDNVDTTDVTITDTGEANTTSNAGAGEGTIAKTKSGVDLPLKTLKQGTNITITNNADDITIDSTGGAGGYDTIQEEGVGVAQESVIDFQGAGVTATADTGKTVVTIPGSSPTGYQTIQEEGSGLAQETVLDFVGAGVTATVGTGKTVVTIPGGSGGGATIGDVTLGAPSDIVDITLSPAVDLVSGDVGKIVLCGINSLATDVDTEALIIRINGSVGGTDYQTQGWVVNLGGGTGHSFGNQDHWISHNDIFNNNFMKITLAGRLDPSGILQGLWEYGGIQVNGSGAISLNNPPVSITSIQISKRQGATLGGTMATGSRFWVRTEPF